MKIYDKYMKLVEPRGACVATIGFFDGVHRGHRHLIEQVVEEAHSHGLPSVLVTFPQHPARVLRPATPLLLLTTGLEKAHLLAESGADHVAMLPFTRELAQLSAREFMQQVLLEQLHVQTLVMGYDHRFGHTDSNANHQNTSPQTSASRPITTFRNPETFDDYVRMGRELGIEVVQATKGDDISSSFIRHLLLTGEVERANRALGYDYFLEGQVVDGFHVGRTLGFTTANIHPDSDEKLIPLGGVYAVGVTLPDGTEAQGMLNIGSRPTLQNGTEQSIEVNIFDFHRDLYTQHIRIRFLHFVREEQQFASLEALQQQLRNDEERVRKLLKGGGGLC